MKLFLYRTLEVDEDGDPYDHGVVRAMTMDHAAQVVTRHIADLDLGEMVDTIRLYSLEDRNTAGVLKEGNEPTKDFSV